MSVIIRLQNLPWSANAMDIRQFFHGLSIPEGGVHIVGGELGDAFIAFSTDEDARQAFNLTNGRIKEVQIKLMLSSRTEMQKVIEAARSQSMAAFIGTPTAPLAPTIATPAPPLIAPPPPSLSTPSQSTPTPQISIPPTPMPPTLGSMHSLLPAMVPDVQPFGDANLQNQQLQHQQQLLHQQLQQVQQQVVASKESSSSSKDSNSRDRRRSRSRSRERRDRKRDRRRSRSRSRDRRDRRRRDRSRSRERKSSSRERDRKSRDASNRKSADNKTNSSSKSIGVWENPPPRVDTNLLQNQTTLQLLGSLIPNANLLNLDPAVVSLLPAALDPWMQAIAPDIQLNSLPIINDSLIHPANNDSTSDNKSNSRDRDRVRDTGRDRERDRDHDRDRNRNRDRGHNTDRNISLDSSNDSANNRNKIEDGRRNNNRNSRSDPENDCCIRLFPYYGGFGEIRRFFTGLFINSTGIKFALSPNKEQTGVALIRFVSVKDKEKSLERNGQTLKGMELQISSLSDEHFDNGTDPQAIVNLLDLDFKTEPFTCLIIQDLPPFTTNHHLLKLFSDYSVLNIYIVHKHRGPSLGYIKFGSAEDARKALVDKARHSVEGKRVRVGPCKEEIFEGIRKQQEGDQDQGVPMKLESDGATPFILLTDIPHKSNDRDVADFFSDIGIVPANIYMVRDENGVFNGETYCEFFSVDEARVAYQKKGVPMGTSTVSMTYVTKQFMEMNIKIINVPHDNNINHNGPRLPLINPLLGGLGAPGILGMPMLPRPFFPRGMHRGMGMPGPMGPRGMLRMPRPPMNMHPRMNMRFPRAPHPMQQQSQQSQQQQYEDDEEIAPPGCTLLMENVPFKAELEEILEFFDGFDVSPDNVLRKYDSQGRPSGETKIIFNSPEEVFHILQEKRGTKIRDRLIYLSQC